jgi:DNA-directed RNA polymerase subunit RPC12/RpoP
MSVSDKENNWIDKEYNKCPRCKIGQLNKRVHRDPFVKYVLFWQDIKRYRCNNCWAKVYIKSRKKDD